MSDFVLEVLGIKADTGNKCLEYLDPKDFSCDKYMLSVDIIKHPFKYGFSDVMYVRKLIK